MIIRRISFLLALSLVLASCGDKSFVINGHIDGAEAGTKIYLDILGSQNLQPYDSTEINEEGYFMMEGEITMPEFFLLRISNESFITTLLEPNENLSIRANVDSLNNPSLLDGSPGTKSMHEYNQRLYETVEELGGLSEIYTDNIDNPDLDKVMEDLDLQAAKILDEINMYTKEYIDRNLTSMVAMVALYQQISPGVYVLKPMEDLEYFKKVDSVLFNLYPESEPIISLHDQVTALVESVEVQSPQESGLGIGSTAPDFTLPDKDGNEVALSSTRGKVVLLDFWAAWCPPCRQENPNLVAAHKKYKDKGFEIFQVSLDQTRDAWLKGIADDNLEQWVHVSDLKYWESAVVSLYGLESIPSSYLLDPEGKIIASNLRGEALIETLDELF